MDLLDIRYMQEALSEARAAALEGEVPVGAVVIWQSAIIARAHNRREQDKDPAAHAEFLALREASRVLDRWRLSGCTVYVTLEPCSMCAGLMVNARIDRCVYGAADPKGGALGSVLDLSSVSALNHAFEVCGGVCAQEASELLKEFFSSRRNTHSASLPSKDGEHS